MKNASQPQPLLNLGWIPYWNLLPFRKEFERAKLSHFSIKSGHPTAVNQWLTSGQVHLAPCSSVCLVQNPQLEMAIPLGVASNGETDSVYWGLTAEHLPLVNIIWERARELRETYWTGINEGSYDSRQLASKIWESCERYSLPFQTPLPSLNLTQNSASSSTLSQILYCLLFGFEAYKTMMSQSSFASQDTPTPIELVIGDEALMRKSSFHKVIDLGSLWKEITGLPFVYAVWQSKGAFLNGWRRKIMEIGELSEAKMRIDCASYLPTTPILDNLGQEILLADYWKKIYYKLGAKEYKGLLLFLCLARHFKNTPLDSNLLVKLMRWQELTTQQPSYVP